MARPFDLVIIGLGAAGLTAARLAGKELGLRVAAVERSAVGGDCLWTGCVPSKSLIASARAIADARRAGEVGINIPSSEVDTSQVWRRLAQVRAEIATAETDAEHVRDWGVELFVGRATVAPRSRLDSFSSLPEAARACQPFPACPRFLMSPTRRSSVWSNHQNR
jgi:pyruvate/2-oxoglutarate dehydrogenase complex dihydrolipoamide dehydrogenase (E3) component